MESKKDKVKNKGLFVAFSCLSMGCLVGSFAYPLQKFEIWQQSETNPFGKNYTKTFVISEADQRSPYGLDKAQGQKIASIYEDSKAQKLLLLVTCIMSASAALILSEQTVPEVEIQAEVAKIEGEAKQEFIIDKIKHKWAMATQAQKQLFREELQTLAQLFGEATLEADEINATDKFINANYLLAEGHSIEMVVKQTWGFEPGTPEYEQIKARFQKWLDEES